MTVLALVVDIFAKYESIGGTINAKHNLGLFCAFCANVKDI